MSPRAGARLTAVLAAVLVLSVLAPIARAQTFPALGGLTLGSVRAVDTNGDSLFDIVQVQVTGSVSSPGDFQFLADLGTSAGRILSSNSTWARLPVGAANVTVTIPGRLLRFYGVDGPYSLHVVAVGYNLTDGFAGPSATLDAATPAWKAGSFDPIWADFGGAPTATPVDTDGDSLYDQLAVYVPVSVVDAGPVDVQASLLNNYGCVTLAANTGEERVLEPGPFVWTVTFDGLYLSVRGLDGPYRIRVDLLLPGMTGSDGTDAINQTTFTTAAYSHLQFAGRSADFSLAGPSDTLVDADHDGFAERLTVHVPVRVRVEGDYDLRGDLFYTDYNERTGIVAERYIHLAPGAATLDLNYAGASLFRLTYGDNVSAYLSLRRLDGSPWDANWTNWQIPGFSPGLFQGLSETDVVGHLIPALGGCSWPEPVQVMDPNASLLEYTSPAASDGSFSFRLYPGTFYFLAADCTGASRVTAATISGMTAYVNLSTPAPVPTATNYTLVFDSWNRTTVSAAYDRTRFSAALRFMADAAGDMNGVANASELVLASEVSPDPGGGFSVSVDGLGFIWHGPRVLGAQGTGPLTSSADVVTDDAWDVSRASPPLSLASHDVQLNLVYPYPVSPVFGPYTLGRYQVEVEMPDGVGGNLAASGQAFEADPLPAAYDLNVRSAGSGAWILTPGTAPYSSSSFLWASIVVHITAAAQPVSSALPSWAGVPVLIWGVIAGVSFLIVALVAVGLWLESKRRRGAP